MPNHVKNVLKFKNLKPDDIAFIVNTIASPITRPEDYPPSYAIDFDKIIPEPRTIEDCSPEFIIPEDKRAKSGLEITDDRDWFDWYDWHVTNWGTKWNAYECYTKQGKSYIQFIFLTAWSMPYEILLRLALLGYDMDIRYADEDLGSNCGKSTYTSEQGWTHWDESELKNPYKFASNLWNKY